MLVRKKKSASHEWNRTHFGSLVPAQLVKNHYQIFGYMAITWCVLPHGQIPTWLLFGKCEHVQRIRQRATGKARSPKFWEETNSHFNLWDVPTWNYLKAEHDASQKRGWMAQGLVEIISAAVVLVPEEVPYRMQYIQALQPLGIGCLFFCFSRRQF